LIRRKHPHIRIIVMQHPDATDPGSSEVTIIRRPFELGDVAAMVCDGGK
jgi:hypothetical protein